MTEETTTTGSKYGVTVQLQPAMKTVELGRTKTVQQLLNRLELRPTAVLVIRDGNLLTADRRLWPGDEVIVRTVVSSG